MNTVSYRPINYNYVSTQGIGYYIDGNAQGLTRGGNYLSGTLGYGNIAGAYTLDFSKFYASPYPTTGYRCVYRP